MKTFKKYQEIQKKIDARLRAANGRLARAAAYAIKKDLITAVGIKLNEKKL